VILWAERREHTIRVHSVDDMTPLDALKLGLAQMPGADSRHLALGRDDHRRPVLRPVAQGGDRVFLLPRRSDAVRGDDLQPVQGARAAQSFDDIGMWVVGFVSAFVSAFLCVRWLLRFISSHDFTPFAWYRIAFGVVVLATWQLDLVAWTHG
jgi:undecaprenyl-diphosphatase